MAVAAGLGLERRPARRVAQDAVDAAGHRAAVVDRAADGVRCPSAPAGSSRVVALRDHQVADAADRVDLGRRVAELAAQPPHALVHVACSRCVQPDSSSPDRSSTPSAARRRSTARCSPPREAGPVARVDHLDLHRRQHDGADGDVGAQRRPGAGGDSSTRRWLRSAGSGTSSGVLDVDGDAVEPRAALPSNSGDLQQPFEVGVDVWRSLGRYQPTTRTPRRWARSQQRAQQLPASTMPSGVRSSNRAAWRKIVAHALGRP